MASTIIDPIGQQIKALAAALTVTPAIKAYWPPIAMPDRLPAAMVQPPAVRRRDPDDNESQMGSEDWNMTFGVSFYFDLSNATDAQSQGVEFFEAFVAAVDNDPTLGGTVLDAKVTEGEPDYSKIADRKPVFIYDCTVAVLALVAQ
jgi:hypothetical protein